MENNIILYGYSSVGEAVYQELIKRGMRVNCFCEDNDIKRNYAKIDFPKKKL